VLKKEIFGRVGWVAGKLQGMKTPNFLSLRGKNGLGLKKGVFGGQTKKKKMWGGVIRGEADRGS